MSEEKDKKINKKYIIFALICLTIVIMLIAVVNIINSKRILIRYSYYNMAWGFSYSGLVVCRDGSIYEFKFDNKDQLETTDDIELKAKNILDNTTEKVGKMDKDDLKRLKELLSTVEDNTTSNHVAYDFGQSSIIYYNYKTNETITIKSSGDYNTYNTSDNIDEILDILEKYDISV